MAYLPFDGRLDEEEDQPGFVPFVGKLDPGPSLAERLRAFVKSDRPLGSTSDEMTSAVQAASAGQAEPARRRLPGETVLDRPPEGFTPSQGDLAAMSRNPEAVRREILQQRPYAEATQGRAPSSSEAAGAAVQRATANPRLAGLARGAVDTALLAPETVATGAKFLADIANLGTLGAAEPVSDWLGATINAIQSDKSNRYREQRAEFGRLMQSDEAGVVDVLGFLATNPRYAVELGVPSLPAMLAAAGAGRAAGALNAALTARRGGTAADLVAAYRSGAMVGAVGGSAALNAGSTFSETEAELIDRLAAAGVAGAGSVVAGRIFQGGAEAALAGAGRQGLSTARRVATTAGREAGQEFIEGASQEAGQSMAEDRFDLGQVAKAGAAEAAIAAPMGAGAGLFQPASPLLPPPPPPRAPIAPIVRDPANTIVDPVAGITPTDFTDVLADGTIITTEQARQQRVAQTFERARVENQPTMPMTPEQVAALMPVPATPPRPRVEPQAQQDDTFAALADEIVRAEREQAAPAAPVQTRQSGSVAAFPAQGTDAAAPAPARVPTAAAPAPDPSRPLVPREAPKPAPRVVLQNRDRSTPASISQMQAIAARPDYARVSVSRTFADGAPVVFGGSVPPERMGRADNATAGDRRFPVQYAVVEADEVLTSNNADGTSRPEYADATDRMRAVAGNGRVAGLQAAYQRGTTADYRAELEADTLHGIDPAVIRGMRNPVLVRVMPAEMVTPDIGDVSNTTGTLELSATEQARNDSRRVDLGALEFDADGAITPQAVRRFVQAMPQAEQGKLLDTDGSPTRQAVDRLQAAVFAQAYDSDALVRLYAQATDPEARNVMSALAAAAPSMARLDGAGDLDIRDAVTQAAEQAINARRRGIKLADMAAQADIQTGDDVRAILSVFAANPRRVKVVADALRRAADFAHAEANKDGEDMFGAVERASRSQVMDRLFDDGQLELGAVPSEDAEPAKRPLKQRLEAVAQSVRNVAGGAGPGRDARTARLLASAAEVATVQAQFERAVSLDPDLAGILPTDIRPVTDAEALESFDALADALASVTRVPRVLLVESGGDFDGINFGSRMLVNLTGLQKPALFVAGHEASHAWQRLVQAGDADAVRVIKPMEDAIWSMMPEADRQRYAAEVMYPGVPWGRVQASPQMMAKLRLEMLADFHGRRLSDPATVAELARREPGIFGDYAKRVISFLNTVIGKLRGSARGSAASNDIDSMVRDLQAAKMVWAEAMIAWNKRGGASQAPVRGEAGPMASGRVSPQRAAKIEAAARKARESLPGYAVDDAVAMASRYAGPPEVSVPADTRTRLEGMLRPLMERAMAQNQQFSDAVRALAGRLGAEAKTAPVKGMKRSVEKLHADEQQDGSPAGPDSIKDLVRASIVVRVEDEIPDAIAAVRETMDVVRLKDRFDQPMPTGYRDVLLNVRLPDGMLAELQIHIPEMLAAKELGHMLYEVERAMAPGPQRDVLVEGQRRLYGAAYDVATGAEPRMPGSLETSESNSERSISTTSSRDRGARPVVTNRNPSASDQTMGESLYSKNRVPSGSDDKSIMDGSSEAQGPAAILPRVDNLADRLNRLETMLSRRRRGQASEGDQDLFAQPAEAVQVEAPRATRAIVDGPTAAARQIAEAIREAKQDDPYATYALRVLPESQQGSQPGDVLPESYVWADGNQTEQTLDGTSAIRVQGDDERSVMAALRNLGATGLPPHQTPNGVYRGKRIALVRGESAGPGEDVGEVVLRDAEVVALWDRDTAQWSPIRPNEDAAPAGAGAMSAADDFALARPTRADVLAQQQAAADETRTEAARRRQRDEDERRDREQRDIADRRRQDASAENFVLGQDADDSLAGQGALFSRRRTGDNAGYETDLFGDPVPQPSRADRPARPQAAGVRGDMDAEPAVLGDTPAPPGNYGTRTKVGVIAQRKLGATRIRTPEDAAAATRYLYRSAVERLDGIVTDKGGRPLAVVGGFKGALAQASVYPATLMGEAIRVPGAAMIWFSHNHPSGGAALSQADARLSRELADVFRGTGIDPMGLLSIGRSSFGIADSMGNDLGIRDMPDPKGEVTVPAIEREISEQAPPSGEFVSSPAEAKRMAAAYYQAANKAPGLLLLNSQHGINAWVPLPVETIGKLRGTGGLAAIYRAISESNAGAALIVHGGELDASVPGYPGITLGQNIGAALGRIDVRPLDIINARTGKSIAEQGGQPALGPVYSQRRPGRVTQGDQLLPDVGQPAPAPPPRSTWRAPVQTRTDNIIYQLQDKQIDLRRVTDAVKDLAAQQGRTVGDREDAYLRETLFHGRADARIVEFMEQELKPLLDEMRLSNVKLADVEAYLHARHAPERNAAMRRRNPDMKNNEALSGMTNAEAARIMAKATPTLERLAARVDAMIGGTKTLMEVAGLETADTMAALRGAYAHYVPLYRGDDGGESGPPGTGQGFSVRGSGVKRATGSNEAAANILAHIVMEREATIIRAEKNLVAMSVYAMAMRNPNPDFWTVDQPPKERVVDERTGLVVERVPLNYKGQPNVLVVRVNGQDRIVSFNESNPRAMRMARALKNDDALLGLPVIGAATRWLASVNTQYNPVFAVVNGVRDVQQAMLSLTNTPIAGEQAAVLSGAAKALPAIWRANRDPKAKGEWETIYREFRARGGQTGWRQSFEDANARTEELARMLASQESMAPKRAALAFLEMVSVGNIAVENALRVGAYKAAKDKGLSPDRAADLAKNLTVNFNRKGRVGALMGSMYAFFNAAMQGNARVLETLRGPKGKAIIAGGIGIGVLQALLLASMDDEDQEAIPEFIKERNLIIPIGGGKLVQIPMPLGFHVLPNIGRNIAEMAIAAASGERVEMVDRTGTMMMTVLDAFNPMGGTNSLLQFLAPSVVDPAVQLMENRDFGGNPIYRARSDFGGYRPGEALGRDSTSPAWKGAAMVINRLSGGDEFARNTDLPAWLSPQPEALRFIAETIGGGVWRESEKLIEGMISAARGEEVPANRVVLLGRFYGDLRTPMGPTSQFYRNLERIDALNARIRGLRQSDDPDAFDKIDAIARKNPEVDLVREANRYRSDIARLRDERRELALDDTKESRAQAKAIEEEMATLMREFNALVRDEIAAGRAR